MLVIARFVGQSFILDVPGLAEQIVVKILEHSAIGSIRAVRLGITAPQSVRIVREELLDEGEE